MTLVFTIVKHAWYVWKQRCAHVLWCIISDTVLPYKFMYRHVIWGTEPNVDMQTFTTMDCGFDAGTPSLTCCQIWCERWISKFSSRDEYRVCMHQTVLYHLWQIVGTFLFHSNIFINVRMSTLFENHVRCLYTFCRVHTWTRTHARAKRNDGNVKCLMLMNWKMINFQ